MRRTEPPSSSNTPLYFIGRNSRGQWVVQDQSGARGGLFIGRTEALRFAMFENGNRPQAVIMVPGIFELDLRTATTVDSHIATSEPNYSRQYAA